MSKRWTAVKGAAFTEEDVDALYAAFTPIQIEAVRERNDVIPGALEAFANVRARGAAVGTCSGYNRPIMEVVMEGTWCIH